MPAPRGDEDLAIELSALRRAGVQTLVSLLTDAECAERGLNEESAACNAASIGFIRFPIVDRSVPASREGFSILIKQLTALLKAGTFLAIHCRAGIGRSSLVAACVLGACGTNADEAFEQISLVRGCDVPDTPEQHEWVVAFVDGVVT